MSFESFYGGRKGASIVIVKRFDGINIPQEEDHYIYKVAYLAVTPDKSYYLCTVNSDGSIDFIEKDSSNYNTYSWELTLLDGSSVPVQSVDGAIIGNRNLWQVQARGMVQCFELGGSSTNEVNYGEYVIIDTPDKNNPENGKVFCRGWDYDNGYAGAEYKGQIVGPQGAAPELSLEHYETINELTEYVNKFTGEYQVDGFNDLIPGVEGNLTTFNDKIKWITASFKDQWGNIEKCVIGFKIPYLVLDFEANSIDPYNKDYRYKDAQGNWQYHNLIEKDITKDEEGNPLYYDDINNKWMHPFFEKWQVKVPQGIHGINSTNIERIHTKTKTLDMNNGKGVDYYQEQGGEKVQVGTLNKSVDVLIEKFFDSENPEETTYGGENPYVPIYIIDDEYCKVLIDNQEFYVKQEDCYMDIIRYREINFDNYENGEIRFYKIGDYNDIQKITLSETGILTAYYSAKPTPQNLEQILQWIYMDPNPDEKTRTKGIEIHDDGTVRVNYNTFKDGNRNFDEFPHQLKWIKNIQLDNNGTVTITYNVPDSTGQADETQIFDKIIDWITDVSLTQEGKFEVLFNNDTRGDSGKYTTTLEWIDWIVVNEDGSIDFFLNTDPERKDPVYTSLLRLKVIDDIEIQTIDTTLPPSEQLEGTGDQKIHITYNTTHEIPDPSDPEGQKTIPIKDTEIVGNPLNYIIETAISMPSEQFPNIPYSHLLVYYSDPALRQKLGGNISYPSSKVQDYNPSTGEYTPHVWTEWVDLGDVRGSQNGIHIITNVANWDELKEDGHWIPPEQLKDESGQIIVPNGAGWNVTLTTGNGIDLLAFDYQTEEWYSIGSISNDFIDPRKIVTVSAANENHMPDPSDVGHLLNNGLWFGTEVHRYAY